MNLYVNTYTLGLLFCGLCWVYAQDDEYTLTLLHLNDFHARFEQTNIYSGRCSTSDQDANRCFGGLARIRSKVEELRRTQPNVLFMGAGDYYQGTVWYTIHKWRAMSYFLNLLQQDVMSVGNHEFDDGVDGLVPFLDNVTFPVLAANIDDSREPSIRGKIHPSVVFTKGGRKIGIIGYVTTETEMIAQPGRVVFLDEVESVRKECRRLKGLGVDILIALGHAGFRKDLDIASNVEDIDIVVGGHTNTFLYSGSDPSTEPSVGDYPTIVKQKNGRDVLVVQAYAFGKYLGNLEATFDFRGEIVRWKGNPILLDNSVPQEPEILRELIPWRRQVEDIISETIGRTFVFLDGNRLSCRMRECNLGSLETDAIIHQNAKYPDDMEWARTSLAVLNSGGIRSSIDERASNGSISMEDILTIAPFQNTIDIVELYGRDVRAMFEHSVKNYDPAGLDPSGSFLQVSGFHVVYDVSKPSGMRVVSLAARCLSCRVPEMQDVEDNSIYKVAMPAFLANGGDGYFMVRDNKIRHHLTGLLDTDIISQYIRLFSPIYQGIENRILFLQSSDPCSALSAPPLPSNSSTPTTSPTSSPSTTRRPIPTPPTQSPPSVISPKQPSTSMTSVVPHPNKINVRTKTPSRTGGSIPVGHFGIRNGVTEIPHRRTKTPTKITVFSKPLNSPKSITGSRRRPSGGVTSTGTGIPLIPTRVTNNKKDVSHTFVRGNRRQPTSVGISRIFSRVTEAPTITSHVHRTSHVSKGYFAEPQRKFFKDSSRISIETDLDSVYDKLFDDIDSNESSFTLSNDFHGIPSELDHLHNPSKITPHQMVKETMDRHDQFFHQNKPKDTPKIRVAPVVTSRYIERPQSQQKVYSHRRTTLNRRTPLHVVPKTVYRDVSESVEDESMESFSRSFFHLGDDSIENFGDRILIGKSVV